MDFVSGKVIRAGVCMALVACPGMAHAHSPIAGIGTFYAAMLHPLAVPGHALVIVGLSLAFGQQGRSAARLGLPVLLGAFAAGLGAAMVWAPFAPPQTALLLLAAVIGAAVTVAAPLPLWLVGAASTVSGLAMGLDSAPDPANTTGTLLAAGGLSLGIAIISMVIAGTSLTLDNAWMRIGLRIVGSWIVAASVLVLALLLHNGRPSTALSIAIPTRLETTT